MIYFFFSLNLNLSNMWTEVRTWSRLFGKSSRSMWQPSVQYKPAFTVFPKRWILLNPVKVFLIVVLITFTWNVNANLVSSFWSILVSNLESWYCACALSQCATYWQQSTVSTFCFTATSWCNWVESSVARRPVTSYVWVGTDLFFLFSAVPYRDSIFCVYLCESLVLFGALLFKIHLKTKIHMFVTWRWTSFKMADSEKSTPFL